MNNQKVVMLFNVVINSVMELMSFRLIVIFMFFFQAIPTYSKVVVEPEDLKSTVMVLANDIGARNAKHYEALEETKQFIVNQFTLFGYTPLIQKYKVDGREFSNVSVILGPESTERLVVGAHYDSFGDQAGADDNASGVSGVLMLAKLLKKQESKLTKQIELVAYTLEEPPFFRTKNMGSFVHANNLHENAVSLIGMIAIEMIGYYSEQAESQNYPVDEMSLVYPDKGNFIAVVSNVSSTLLESPITEKMKDSGVTVQSLVAPDSLLGVDFSDHLNYWNLGYKAVMITDTAFYRNPHYHEITDTPEKLNYDEMAKTIEGLYDAILHLLTT